MAPDDLPQHRGAVPVASRVLVLSFFLWLAAGTFSGCGKSQPAIDPAPMKVAIEQYLRQNNMQLRIKDIEQGPVVSGTKATMHVSLTHAELGGPSVVWEFEFEQEPGGTWRVLRHKN
jgi:hypothetical protein